MQLANFGSGALETMWRRVLGVFLIPLLAALCHAPPVDAQDRENEQVRLDLEAKLRASLKKLSRWEVSQLLRTQREVDNEQKKRAIVSTNPRELDLLADDEDVGVRFFVASNRHTALPTSIALARDPEHLVRSGVAMALSDDPLASREARQLTTLVGRQLAADRHVLVRLSLASNRTLQDSVYLDLLRDEDYAVRKKLAENSRLPRDVLTALATDSVATVQIAALAHRNMPSSALRQGSLSPELDVRGTVAMNKNTPMSVLEQLADDPMRKIRRLVAIHPATDLATLKRMVFDVDAEVVLSVANHPNADRTLLTALAYDERDGVVRMAAQKRLEPLLRREIREDILERWKTD